MNRVGATKKQGTKTTFKADSQIFQTTKFSYDTLHKRLQELAFLNRGGADRLSRRTKIMRAKSSATSAALSKFVEHLNRASEAIHGEVIYLSGESDGVGYELALQYSNEYTENLHSYVNNIHTHEGGTHVSGFRSALTRSLNAYAPERESVQGRDANR